MSDIDLTIVISEMNLVESNPKEWWVDNGATHQVCSNKKMFSTFEIKGQGKAVSKITSGNELTLTNVLYVPKIHKNLVSSSLLNSKINLFYQRAECMSEKGL